MATLNGLIARATVSQTSRQEHGFGEASAGPRLTRASAVFVYAGEVEGEGVLEELRVGFADGSATLYAIERVSGSVGGRPGSFVLEHVGSAHNGVATSRRTVVPGSGTGELAGLRGVIEAACGRASTCAITFHYCFD
jgi:hypothetical protein